MAKILTITPAANVHAVRRQLARVRNAPVALDLPAGWSVLDNVARMRLVQRQAQTQHCELAICTREPGTRKTAQQLGIPVFSDAEAAAAGNWRMHPSFPLVDPQHPENGLPEPPPWRRSDIVARSSRPKLHQARQRRIRSEEAYRRPTPWWLRAVGYTFLAGLIVTVLAAFAYNVLPAATITLVPGRGPISVTVQLTANPALDVPDLEARSLPARLIEMTIEETGSTLTTGSQQKPVDKAVGNVVFTNLGTTPVDIPVGTVVNTGTGTPVDFRTTAPGRIEGGVGARATVPIEAVEPGVAGNVRANTINNVNGALRFRARVSNSDGTVGGGSQLVPSVTQQDQDNLLAQVQGQVEAKAYETLQAALQPGEWMPPKSVRSFTVAQVFDKFNDDEGGQLGLTLRALVQGTALNQAQTDEVMLSALRSAVPEAGLLVADSVAFQRASEATVDGPTVTFTMTANADYVVPIDPAEVRKLVAGLTPEEAATAITARWQLEQAPEFYQDPGWTGTLPKFPNRIQVRVEYTAAEAE